MAELSSQELNKGASLVGMHDADNNFIATNVEGALKEAIEQSNAAFTSANNGKTSLKSTIIGKGGKVVQVGDIASYEELDDGIKSIPTGGMDFASGTNFSTIGTIHSYGDDGAVYATQLGSQRKLSRNLTLLKQYPVRTTFMSNIGYAIYGGVDVEIYNECGTLLHTLTGHNFGSQGVLFFANSQLLYVHLDFSTKQIRILNMASTLLFSVSGKGTLFLSTNNNAIAADYGSTHTSLNRIKPNGGSGFLTTNYISILTNIVHQMGVKDW